MRLNLLFLCFLATPVLFAQSFERNDTLFNQTGPGGLKQGYWEKTYPDGTLQYRGFFRDGKPRGEFIRYHENGLVKAAMYFPGKEDISYAKLFYANGSLAGEGKYIGSRKDSTWKYYSFYGGYLSFIENYAEGKKHGVSTKFYADGSISEKMSWKKGMKDGPWEQYYIDGGLLLKCSYEKDKLDGEYLICYPDGKTQITGTYRMDVRQGPWKYYDAEGELKVTIEYKNGVALNQDRLNQKELDFLNELEKNKGKFSDPEIEDLIGK